jgi:Fe-S-cluster containining protein
MVQALTDQVVSIGSQSVESAGKGVSCRAGCGACCRQLVPIAEVEARQLCDLVQAMPEPRRTTILERFASARDRLREAGHLERLLHPESFPSSAVKDYGLEYFQLGIACPFLEAESCSIHPDRPLVCREYLVTSPAENCAAPWTSHIEKVGLPFSVSEALVECSDLPTADADSRPWVPLITLLDWVAAHPDTEQPMPGPQLVAKFFENLQRNSRATDEPSKEGANQA